MPCTTPFAACCWPPRAGSRCGGRSARERAGPPSTRWRGAALLLTGTPACVLNAEDTSLDDRLAFIDWVMDLLPYGFRARMAAATWTRAPFRDHKFRLYFSAAPRQGDHVVHWGQPDRAALPEGPVRDYFGQLEKSASQLTRLASPAEDAPDLRFDNKAAIRALELIDPPSAAAPPT